MTEPSSQFSQRLFQTLKRLTPFGVGLWALSEGWDRPDELKRALVVFGGIAIAIGVIVEGRHLIYRLLPPPWLPDQFWRAPHWLKRRPRHSIMFMNMPTTVQTESGLIDSCRLAPTIWEDTIATGVRAAILYENATLVMRQKRHGAWRSFVFRPTEVGGFLSQQHAPEQRAVIVEFNWTAAPQWADDAPDFNSDYDLTLKGVTAKIQTDPPLSGSLPTLKWRHPVEAIRQANLRPSPSASSAM